MRKLLIASKNTWESDLRDTVFAFLGREGFGYDDGCRRDLRSGGRVPKRFYVWGHSYAFDKKDNWQHLDEL